MKGVLKRYKFLSYIYPDRVVIILKKGEYYVFGDSELILAYIKFKGCTLKLRDKHINYIVVCNMDIVEKGVFPDNRYEEYLLRSKIASTFDRLAYFLNKRSVESLDATIKEEIG